MESEREPSRPGGHEPKRVAAHLRLGAYGENLAAAHLRRDGMRLLDRNWRCGSGELDIIAYDRGVTVFCEVKTRRSLRFGTPMQAIDDAKAARIRRLAAIWQQQRAKDPRLSDRARARRIRQAEYDTGTLRSHRAPGSRGRPSGRAATGDAPPREEFPAHGPGSGGGSTRAARARLGGGQRGNSQARRQRSGQVTPRDASPIDRQGREATSPGRRRPALTGRRDDRGSKPGGWERVAAGSGDGRRSTGLSALPGRSRADGRDRTVKTGDRRATVVRRCGDSGSGPGNAEAEPTAVGPAAQVQRASGLRQDGRFTLRGRSRADIQGCAGNSDGRRVALAGRCGGSGSTTGGSERVTAEGKSDGKGGNGSRRAWRVVRGERSRREVRSGLRGADRADAETRGEDRDVARRVDRVAVAQASRGGARIGSGGRSLGEGRDRRRRMDLAGRCGERGSVRRARGRGRGESRAAAWGRSGHGGGRAWMRGLTCGIVGRGRVGFGRAWMRGLAARWGGFTGGFWVVASAVVNVLWRGGADQPRNRRARRFDVVCVVVGGDGTVTIDHRRGVL